MEERIRKIIRLVRNKDQHRNDWCENRLYIEIAKVINEDAQEGNHDGN